MNGNPGMTAAEVRLLRQDQVDAGLAAELGFQRLAEITHLPTGIASDQVEALDLPAGGRSAPRAAVGSGTLLHVVAGHVRVRWGDALDRETPAGPGDTVLVPGGTRFLAENASGSATVQLIVVRGE